MFINFPTQFIDIFRQNQKGGFLMNEEKSNTNKGCLPLMIIAVVLVVAFMAFCMRLDSKSTSNTQQATEVTSSVVETTEATETTTADNVPKEYKSALKSAQRYSDNH